jgi:adenylate kinase
LLIREEQERNPGVKLRVQQALEKGEDIPDEVTIRQVDARLKESDCQVNGWVLDGFPQSETQIQLLRASKIRPTLVCMMDQPQDESIRRLANRRVDPISGSLFNLETNQAKTEEQANRLITMKSDEEPVVRKRYDNWTDRISTIEEEFKACLLTITSDRLMDQVSDQIADAIQNPVF